jgi:hypothetical protein
MLFAFVSPSLIALAALLPQEPSDTATRQSSAWSAVERVAAAPAGAVRLWPQAEGSSYIPDWSWDAARQVRIHRRVIIRITPVGRSSAVSSLAPVPRPPAPPRAQTRFEERKHDDCLSVDEVRGVRQATNERLVLTMRDRRLLSLELARACPADAFYSGFYVERAADGRMCDDRDELVSRTGARCQVRRIRRLVAVRD